MSLLTRAPAAPKAWIYAAVCLAAGFCHPQARAAANRIDLSSATLVLPATLTPQEHKAAEMLLDEVEKRTQIRWTQADHPTAGHPSILLGEQAALASAFPALAGNVAAAENNHAEGYRIVASADGTVVVSGNDARGVLYGAGRLLRLMEYTGETAPDHLGTVSVAAGLNLATAPRYALRGHQMGYRAKTNAYDAWSVPMWEQYVRDLVIFGANAIEGIPPRSDDRPDSPHFTLPPMQMLIAQSRLAKEYGIEYWIFYPLMEKNYSDAATVDNALKEFERIIAQLPRIDAIYIPGGDPGHVEPKTLFPVLEKFTAVLRRVHPEGRMWMSPQGFDGKWMDEFYQIMKAEPDWLEGIAFGPQGRETIDDIRAKTPKRYKMRLYPDITHSLASQFPASDWDAAYAFTENREVTNPRPLDEAAAFHRMMPYAEYGVLTYSEGCNDDVNKTLWSALAWNPDQDVLSILRDYSHYFIGGGVLGEGFAQGQMALEQNWKGPLISNEGVYRTLAQFQDLERMASPAVLENWRFQQSLYRAYYDAADRARLIGETQQENHALDQLRRAPAIGSLPAVAAAEAALVPPETVPGAAWRARVYELAEALFQSIHAQLSVQRYQAEAVRRGANLDLMDFPLNDAPWLGERFNEIRAGKTEPERRRKIDDILHWADPGPGGFYDNLGSLTERPHLVLGKSYADDPAYERSPMVGFAPRTRAPFARVSSSRFAETLHDQALEMRYEGLDRRARYKLRVLYGSETETKIQLVANGHLTIQPLEDKFQVSGADQNYWDTSQLDIRPIPREFDLPAEATADGTLQLTWSKPPGDGGTGRGVQVAEVWLVRTGEIAPARTIDLSAAPLVLLPGMTGPEHKAVQMLVEEVEKRSQIRWRSTEQMPAIGSPKVVLGERAAILKSFPGLANDLKPAATDGKAEGYHIVSLPGGLVIVAGNDARGVLYGAGRLLRLLSYTGEKAPDHLGTVTLEAGLDLATAPAYALRGHQLGYRPKTNAYDGWSATMWEQYIRDLVIFGANAIEGIPPRSDDIADSTHFTLPPEQMLIEQSRIAQEYGIEFWVWYPAMDHDYSDQATVDTALKEWAGVLRSLPRLDAIFVPGGDPGHTPPKVMFPFLEKQIAQLRQQHPGVTLWMSPQGFDSKWMDDFFAVIKTEPTWLDGIVFGPQQRMGLEELRPRIPKRYKMRFYPDITHSLECQYPVPDWDYVFPATENREVTNPRPLDETAIFRRLQPLAETGFLTYSEGCNDDINKCLWSCLGWDPDRSPVDIMRDYSRYFIGDGATGEGFAQGLMALERNWRGSLLANAEVDTTLQQFQDLEKSASPAVLENWRFQAALYRAYYDAADRSRLIAETAQEDRALDQLRRSRAIGAKAAIAAARQALTPPETPSGAALRARVSELAEALFQSIHAQLSVSRYQGEAIGRGANLDLLDAPISDAPWLNDQFDRIESLKTEPERLKQIDQVLGWSDPGADGFYDNLGDVVSHPHLVAGSAYADDPAFLHAPFIGNGGGPRAETQMAQPPRNLGGGGNPELRAAYARYQAQPAKRISSSRFAQTLHEQPLELAYAGLDPSIHYRLKVVYGAGSFNSQIRLVANGDHELAPLARKPIEAEPIVIDVPAELTAGGTLRLSWSGPPGLGGDGRGVQVSEVWLGPTPPPEPPARRSRGN